MEEDKINTAFPTDRPNGQDQEPQKPQPSVFANCCIAETLFEGFGEGGGEIACCLAEASIGGMDGCFIATATLDTDNHPDLVSLRAFRDQFLLTNPAGKLFVRTYYKWGALVAKRIQGKPIVCWIIREGFVRPVARLSRLIIK